MEDSSNLGFLLVLLVLIFGAIGWIVSYQAISDEEKVVDRERSDDIRLVTVYGEREVSKSNQLVNERYVKDLDKDGEIIAISNGQAFRVESGAVIANDMLIEVDSDEYSIMRLDRNSRASVSSN